MLKALSGLLLLLFAALACSSGDLVVTSAPPQVTVVDQSDLTPTKTAVGSRATSTPTETAVGAGDIVCVTAETALNLRAWAGDDAPIRTTLSYGELVRLTPGIVVVDGQTWQAVELLTGGGGWVNSAYIGGCG
jgi:uncharacterized protein YgiM (DUF1202 family)